ncbi:histidine phosphatase family protein [Peribacillus sp. SCS-155]|uniref:histidine phosphatase family protein n=1 Tax=Peribacillus sedimenti TaxID=3115297 RepID=UPI0039067D03
MTLLGIIRHGSTAWNKEGRAQGSSDIPLDREGLFQAEKLADRLSKENWDFIYSSDLLRAQKTAEIIGEKLDIPVVVDQRIREAGGGQIEGTTVEERIQKWGDNWRDLDLGMETNQSVVSRGLSFINELIQRHPDSNVLIISHGSFIRQLLEQLVPKLTKTERLMNTSLTKIRLTNDVWENELYNCTKHLTDH